jgi:hypothetical protein
VRGVRFRSPASPYLGVVSVVTAATAFGYTRLLRQQADWPGMDARQALVLTLLIAFAIVGAIGTFARPVAVRAAAAAACAGGLLPLGFLALFSIGSVLMAAGTLAVIAWLRNPWLGSPAYAPSCLGGRRNRRDGHLGNRPCRNG